MKELLISQIAPIVATAIVAILVATIKKVGSAAIEVFTKKKEEIEQKIKISGHESELQQAKEAWNIIEEKFRITENATQILGSKADLFNQLLLQKIPGLTQSNLDDLRQAIAGEFNKGKVALTDDSAKQQISLLQENKVNLEAENADLKAKIDKINNALNPGDALITQA
ncbi:hypothetical protein psyc5s11_44780 [Clostridium gelidum]|uniref:Uncharacterized protein n=1 Tax=Clostridium gelidum TaxID=704125 RepID=A0ABM7TAR1_9CLOT|nr:cobalt ABC transporter permease [Clostridium gelidum]BCZ48411.1 hypothetical protein psyc5s11_44780 [Clostridium gelidum]